MIRPASGLRAAGLYVVGLCVAGFLALALGGCDEDVGCAHDDRVLAVGESVDDIPRRLRCTCTAGGLLCEDLPGAVGLGDAAPPDVGPGPMDMARPPVDMPSPDAIADAMPDAIPDAGPPRPMCPERLIVAGSDCPGMAGAECLEGPAFDCCGARYAAERRCQCAEGRWRCVDLVALCEEDPDIGDCGRRTRLCQRWQATRAVRDPVEGWLGDHEACDAGVMSADWRSATLDRINTYRALAGLRPVDHLPSLDRIAQACALAVRWHGTQDHQLEMNDRCFSRAAAEGVADSLIHAAPALSAVDDYMLDFGEQNFDSLVHRLYLLAPQLGPVGLGSTSLASCVHIANGRGPADAPRWVAWPPAGPFPLEAAQTDVAGWSVHSNVINLAFAEVQVFRDGIEPLEVDVRSLQSAGPAGWGLAWLPVGWDLEAGRSYRVAITDAIIDGERQGFGYTVEPVDCAAP